MTRIVRRRFLALMLSTALSPLLEARRAALAGPSDQGIGGTGLAPPTDDTDRGIGGTGVIGTIRKFGSIVVNDMRIAYAPDATVRIDGTPAGLSDLRLGQVVRVVADGDPGALSTRAIEITSEAVGPVERVSGKQIIVLGQRVDTTTLKALHVFAVGDRVAVSGLRRNDGTIVASLIEPRVGGPDRVAGPVRVGEDGSLRIGDLPTVGVDPSLIDHRAHLEGTSRDGTFNVTRAVSESSLLPASVSRLSVESYVERRNGGLVLGSGFLVSGSDGLQIASGRSVRAVVTTTVGPRGLSLVDVREGGRTFGPRGGASGSGDPGRSGATRPMDFGHGPGGGAPGGGAGAIGPRGFGGGIGGPGGGLGGGMPGLGGGVPNIGGGLGGGFNGGGPGGGLGGGLGGRR